MAASTHYTFEVIAPTGEPKLPKKAAFVFRKQCRVLVRDNVPISVRDWVKRKGANDSDYVAERYKEGLWNELMAHFTLLEQEDPADTEKLTKKVKQWTLQKERLWQNYQKNKNPAVF